MLGRTGGSRLTGTLETALPVLSCSPGALWPPAYTKKGKGEKCKQGRAGEGLLELGGLEILLQLEAGEGLGLARVLLKVLPVLRLLALPQLQGKLQLQGGG